MTSYTLMPLIDLAIASRADASIGNVTYTLDVNLSDTDALTAATDLDTAIPATAVGTGTSFVSKAEMELSRMQILHSNFSKARVSLYYKLILIIILISQNPQV